MEWIAQDIKPGIYVGMDESIYHAASGLSHSGMKDLMVSPNRYWHRHINPARPEREESTEMRFGKALHCRVLEPLEYPTRYAAALSADDFPDALVTTDDLKRALKENELPVSGNKPDLIERLQAKRPDICILDVEKSKHGRENAGKSLLSKDDWSRVESAAGALELEPEVTRLLAGGISEVSVFVTCPESGVLLKSRMDRMAPLATLDLKSFSNFRGKSTDRAVNEAIYYEGYFRQVVFYQRVREIARQALARGEIEVHGNVSEAWLKGFIENPNHGFGVIFVESDQPHEVRIRELREAEREGGATNVYWSTAAFQIDEMIATYAEHMKRFGRGEWREPQKIKLLSDTDLPQLLFT